MAAHYTRSRTTGSKIRASTLRLRSEFCSHELTSLSQRTVISLRIISGKFRGRRLKSPPSLGTRPTSDRLRETLFNILAPRISGARFLDLCAGSGAVGIEALSRGAAHATFVDKSRKMYALIEDNLQALKIDDREFEVISSEAARFLGRFEEKGSQPFDIVFFDPPYAADYETVLNYVGENAATLLGEDGVMVVEHEKRRDLASVFVALERYRLLKQGDSRLSFYRRSEPST
jgi:16S rRNA (guanine(966)-N(2))-methyltransferase RsmD